MKKKRNILVIPVLNMAYFLKGKPQDISDFFPEIPDKEMSKDEKRKFREKIQTKKLNDGRTFQNCFSLHKTRLKQVALNNRVAKMVWGGLNNTTADEVVEVVEEVINFHKKIDNLTDSEIWLLYITNNHEKFNDVRPIVEKLEDKIDNVIVYTDNIEYSSAEVKIRKNFGYKNHYVKMFDFIEEYFDGEKVEYDFPFMYIPYYQYFGAELLDDGDIDYYFYDITQFPYFNDGKNLQRKILPY